MAEHGIVPAINLTAIVIVKQDLHESKRTVNVYPSQAMPHVQRDYQSLSVSIVWKHELILSDSDALLTKIHAMDITNITFRCSQLSPSRGESIRWGPHCECYYPYQRLKNGTCVPDNDPLCVAEYQPSPGNNFNNQ